MHKAKTFWVVKGCNRCTLPLQFMMSLDLYLEVIFTDATNGFS